MIIYEVRAYFNLTGQTTVKYFNSEADAIDYGLAVWNHFQVTAEIREIDTSADTVEIVLESLLRTANNN